VGDAVIHDGDNGYRTGKVTSINQQGRISVTLDPIHLYPAEGGKLAAMKVRSMVALQTPPHICATPMLPCLPAEHAPLDTSQITVERDDLLKAPEPTTLSAGTWVRVAHNAKIIGGQVWQYGKVTHVYNQRLVDINYDGTDETSDHIPTFDVRLACSA